MNLKKFIISGTVGGIVDFLLGWLLWGIIFSDFFPPHDESQMNMLFIFLGCMTFGLFISYVITRWTGITNLITGAKTGAILALFLTLFSNFFAHSMTLTPDLKVFATDAFLTVICGAVVGAVVALINGKIE